MQSQTATRQGQSLHFEAIQDTTSLSDWRVESLDTKSGDVFVTIFSGPLAKERAEEYARFKNSQ